MAQRVESGGADHEEAKRNAKKTLVEVNERIAIFSKASSSLVSHIKETDANAQTLLSHLNVLNKAVKSIVQLLSRVDTSHIEQCLETLETNTRAAAGRWEAAGGRRDSLDESPEEPSNTLIFTCTSELAVAIKGTVNVFVKALQQSANNQPPLMTPQVSSPMGAQADNDDDDDDDDDASGGEEDGAAVAARTRQTTMNNRLTSLAEIAAAFMGALYCENSPWPEKLTLMKSAKNVLECVASIHEMLQDPQDKDKLQEQSQKMVNSVRKLGKVQGADGSKQYREAQLDMRHSMVELNACVNATTQRFLSACREVIESGHKAPLGLQLGFNPMNLMQRKDDEPEQPSPAQPTATTTTATTTASPSTAPAATPAAPKLPSGKPKAAAVQKQAMMAKRMTVAMDNNTKLTFQTQMDNGSPARKGPPKPAPPPGYRASMANGAAASPGTAAASPTGSAAATPATGSAAAATPTAGSGTPGKTPPPIPGGKPPPIPSGKPPPPRDSGNTGSPAFTTRANDTPATPAATTASPATGQASAAASTSSKPAATGDRGRSQSVSVETAAASASRPPAERAAPKSGWLTKQGGSIKTWKRRYTVLQNGILKYYKAEEDVETGMPQGEIFTHLYQVEEAKFDETKRANSFKLVHSDEGAGARTYYFSAETTFERDGWVEAVRLHAENFASSEQKDLGEGRMVMEGDVVVMVLDGQGLISSGTLDALVSRFVGRVEEDDRDKNFVNMFLLTYRHLMTPSDLLTQLTTLFDAVVPAGADVELERLKTLVQEGSLRAIKAWIARFWRLDFFEEPELIAQLTGFVEMVANLPGTPYKQVVSDIKKSILAAQMTQPTTAIKQNLFPNLTPSGDGVESDGKLADMDSEALARQITILDMQLFYAIHAEEFVVNLWGKPPKRDIIIENVMAFIDRFNQVSWWVATEICLTPDVAKRARIMRTFIRVADECYKLHNFNSMMAIISGLNTSPVQRLKKTWGALSNGLVSTMHKLERFMDPTLNYKIYREESRLCGSPVIPFFGLYIKDLTFMNDGNSKHLDNGHVNVAKLRQISDLITELQVMQRGVYNFAQDPDIRAYLATAGVLPEKTLYKFSLVLEPRQAES